MHMVSIWAGLGKQLRTPSGRYGRFAGRLMALINGAPYRCAIAALDVQPHDTVLELGFGPGRGIVSLARQVMRGKVLGIDHSPEMLDIAKRANRQEISHGRVHLRLGHFDDLPYADDSISKVIAINVAYFFGIEGKEIAEIYRVLQPRGRVVIYVTDRATMRKWKFSGSDTHRLYDAADLNRTLRQGGFDDRNIFIETIRLPFGMRGLVAAAVKN
ncbi:class I SAM-dependent methyltransferase [Hyphomicrobium sp. DY-1]|uniref:class I SAM-dependent methyltransferase n=1 Tax=Hyphomicrobium sp. DY-1 TaxID=3075650 RepID=UPI0039C3D564